MLHPENIRYILLAIRQSKTMTFGQARKWLCNDAAYTIEEAGDILLKAILEGFLIAIGSDALEKIQSSNTVKDNVVLNLNNLDSLSNNLADRDPYCYECHIPEALENCKKCPRTFHIKCQRKELFLANTTNNIKLKDHVPIETFLNEDIIDLNSSSNKDRDENNRSLDSTDDAILDEILITLRTSPQSKLKEETSFENDKKDEKSDVLCIGQIREPNRKRANNLNKNYKNEVTSTEDDNINDMSYEDEKLCTACKLSKKSTLLDPANISNDEISYLLQFIYNRIASWIPLDTFTTLPKSKTFQPPSKEDIDILTKYCFKFPKVLADVELKIKNKIYNSFTEFYIDFLDIQHCIGIVYGTASEEYLATEYQMKDCNYELSEIRQCRDCYRRSNDKNYIEDWFCIPCVPRHELVYAKKTPWPYWPAKVIKFKDNKYDVRFFSDRHERAIIDAKYIKPIEVHVPSKASSALRKALLELEKYKYYDQQPVGTFSFEKERVLNRTITPMNLQHKSTDIKIKLRNKNKNSPNSIPSLSKASNNTLNLRSKSSMDFKIPAGSRTRAESRNYKISKQNPTNNTRGSNKEKTATKKYYGVVQKLGLKLDKISNKHEIKNIVMETMQSEMKKLRNEIEHLKEEIIETKKKPWCKWCLDAAVLYCCQNASYCTLQCQKLDWEDEHKFGCTHRNDLRY